MNGALVHAKDWEPGTGYTLCGKGGVGWEGEQLARYGEKVTCPDCSRIIGYCKSFKGGKQP